jgi:hypothetical protein
MQVNYIILAHKNPEQLERLVNRLHAENTFFYIHIDKKIDDAPFKNILSSYSNIFFLGKGKRANSLWGSFGLIKASIYGMQQVLEDKRNGYTVLLSGQCYPLKTNMYIHDFFEKHNGYNFIDGTKMPAAHWHLGGMNRIEKYHFIMSDTSSHFYKLPYIFSKQHTFPHNFTLKKYVKVILRHRVNAFMIFRKRKFPLKLQPYGGSAWWAFPGETVQFICSYIKKHPQYMKFHRYTMLPDEIFFQSIVFNHFNKIMDQVHYIDWNRVGVSLPVVFKKEDFEQIKASGKLFARKFDYDSDKEIFDIIDRELLNANEISSSETNTKLVNDKK